MLYTMVDTVRDIIFNPSHEKTHTMVAKIETIKLLY